MAWNLAGLAWDLAGLAWNLAEFGGTGVDDEEKRFHASPGKCIVREKPVIGHCHGREPQQRKGGSTRASLRLSLAWPQKASERSRQQPNKPTKTVSACLWLDDDDNEKSSLLRCSAREGLELSSSSARRRLSHTVPFLLVLASCPVSFPIKNKTEISRNKHAPW